MIALARTVVAQRSQFSGEVSVVGGDGAGIGECSEIFAWIKTRARSIAQRSRRTARRTSAVRLRRVFEHQQPVTNREQIDRRHAGALTVKMDRKNRLRARRDEGLDFLRIEIVGANVAFTR